MNSRLVAFIYILGRDYLPLGDIEKIIEDHVDRAETYEYSNEYLEFYAKHISRRLGRND
jgi:hypothetical protein